MSWISESEITQEGDLIELVSTKSKYFIFTLESGEEFHTHRGIISHDEIIGKEWGA